MSDWPPKGYPSIGDLRHRITFQEAVLASDGIGGQVEAWQNIADTPTVWARIEPVNGLERFFAEKLEENVSHKITIRYRNDILPQYRILFDGRVFEVKTSRALLERKDFTIIEAIEGVAT